MQRKYCDSSKYTRMRLQDGHDILHRYVSTCTVLNIGERSIFVKAKVHENNTIAK